MDLSFLDEGEFEEEPSDGVATLPTPVKVALAPALEATPTKPVTIEPQL